MIQKCPSWAAIEILRSLGTLRRCDANLPSLGRPFKSFSIVFQLFRHFLPNLWNLASLPRLDRLIFISHHFSNNASCNSPYDLRLFIHFVQAAICRKFSVSYSCNEKTFFIIFWKVGRFLGILTRLFLSPEDSEDDLPQALQDLCIELIRFKRSGSNSYESWGDLRCSTTKAGIGKKREEKMKYWPLLLVRGDISLPTWSPSPGCVPCPSQSSRSAGP